MRWPRLFSKFRLRGGRGGVITAREGSRVAELHWEMLIGEFDMVIYGDQSTWVKPEPSSLAIQDVIRLVGELARDMRINVQLDFGGSSQVFRGRD